MRRLKRKVKETHIRLLTDPKKDEAYVIESSFRLAHEIFELIGPVFTINMPGTVKDNA